MVEHRKIAVAPDLVFDALVGGRPGAPLVLMLHGFPETMHMWRAQVPALAGAGYLAVAPSQRGYSAGARPDPGDLANYHFDKLVGDAMAIAAACGHAAGRFHLVGHDWGGAVAWGVADRHPERLASLTILSRPHPKSFAQALAAPDGDQAYRSRHHKAFLDPATGGLLLADDAQRLRERLASAGVPPDAVAAHVSALGTPAAIEAALAWYRSRGGLRTPIGVIRVPTLYVWGDEDASVGRMAAQGTGEFIDAPYRFEALAGVGHFSVEQAPEAVTALILAHVTAHPV
jgi:pimeloyl-ACP methyl ester carboxylesterase